jgi:butyryl-CoA dehydrogenase
MIELTQEQKGFREDLKAFVRSEVIPIAAEVDLKNEIPWDFRRRLASKGYFGTIVPKELGGRGGGQVDLCIQEEELAYGSASIASSTLASILCQTPFYLAGTKEQKERFMVPIQRGEAMGSIGLTEPNHGSDFASIESTARREGDSYVLDGTKRYIDNTSVSRYFIFWAKTDLHARPKHKGISTFVVERDREGFHVDELNDVIGLRGLGVGGFTCKGVRVPQENLIGKEGEGFYIAMQLLERGRTPTAAICVGLSQAALDAAVDFAKKRVQFGKAIAEHQLIQNKIAEMATQTDAARLLVYRAALLIDRGQRSDKEASMAKYFSAETAMMVTREAVQIHGARGCMKEFPVERMYRDARIFTIGEGTLEIQRITVARRILGL